MGDQNVCGADNEYGKNCEGTMRLVEKEISTTIEDYPDKLIKRGKSLTTYRQTSKIWLCPECGNEATQLED